MPEVPPKDLEHLRQARRLLKRAHKLDNDPASTDADIVEYALEMTDWVNADEEFEVDPESPGVLQ